MANLPNRAISGPLKLQARDLLDMEVIAAMLQDAVARPVEMTYLARNKRFVMVISRFRWEHPGREHDDGLPPDTDPRDAEPYDGKSASSDGQEDARFEDAGPRRLYERVNAGVCFEHVRSVKTQKLDLKDRSQVLSLLTVETRPDGFTLVFSGGALVRLEVSAIGCFLEDLGEPWPTPWRPLHAAEQASAGETAEDRAGRE